MTNKLLILCLLLIASTSIFSQNTLTITSEQLKLTNAIFIEHEKFSKQIPLLEQQISNLEQINNSWQRTDSIRKQQLVYCNHIIEDKNKSIENLNKSLKRNKNLLKGSCVVGAVAVIICLLVK